MREGEKHLQISAIRADDEIPLARNEDEMHDEEMTHNPLLAKTAATTAAAPKKTLLVTKGSSDSLIRSVESSSSLPSASTTTTTTTTSLVKRKYKEIGSDHGARSNASLPATNNNNNNNNDGNEKGAKSRRKTRSRNSLPEVKSTSKKLYKNKAVIIRRPNNNANARPKNNILRLSENVIAAIISFLPLHECVHNCARVCRLWHIASRKSLALIDTLALDPYPSLIDEDIRVLAYRCPNIKKIRFGRCNRLSNTALEFLIDCYKGQIEELQLSRSLSVGLFELEYIHKNCPNLKVFCFQKIYGWKPSIIEYVLDKFNNLEALHIDDLGGEYVEGLGVVSSRRLKHLVLNLNVNNCHYSYYYNNSNNRGYYFDYLTTNRSSSWMMMMMHHANNNAINNNSSIDYLLLNNNNNNMITAESNIPKSQLREKAISDILTHSQQSLRSLLMDNWDFSSLFFRTELPKLGTQLTELHLFNCPELDAQGLERILCCCHELKTLRLANCPLLTDEAMPAFQYCHNLQFLELGTSFVKAFFANASSLKLCPNLKHFSSFEERPSASDSFIETEVSNEDLLALADATFVPRLECFRTFKHCTYSSQCNSNGGWKQFLARATKLRSFQPYAYIDSQTFQFLATSAEHNNNIESLKRIYVRDSSTADFEVISRFKKLTHLNAKFFVRDRELRTISGSSTLEYLHLESDTSVGVKCSVCIADCPRLRELNLDGMRDLVSLQIRNCPALRELNLSNCLYLQFDDELIRSIRGLNLRSLRLDHCLQVTNTLMLQLLGGSPSPHKSNFLMDNNNNNNCGGGGSSSSSSGSNSAVVAGTARFPMSLQRLSLVGCKQITDASAYILAKNVPYLFHLHCPGAHAFTKEAIWFLKSKLPYLREVIMYSSSASAVWAEQQRLLLQHDEASGGGGGGLTAAAAAAPLSASAAESMREMDEFRLRHPDLLMIMHHTCKNPAST